MLDAKESKLLDGDKEAEVKPPKDEIPARTVPHPCEEPHHEEVEDLMLPSSAHGDIQIVSEECPERYVPTPPKVRDRATTVGMIEVFKEVKAQTSPYTDSHVGIAGEVEVDL